MALLTSLQWRDVQGYMGGGEGGGRGGEGGWDGVRGGREGMRERNREAEGCRWNDTDEGRVGRMGRERGRRKEMEAWKGRVGRDGGTGCHHWGEKKGGTDREIGDGSSGEIIRRHINYGVLAGANGVKGP